MNRPQIFRAIEAERERQDNKFPGQWLGKMTYGLRLAILTEEVGEVARAILEQGADSRGQDLETELVQVAAVCVAWLESMK